tara:strand:+ start:3330 stop:3536 length:207 start_codon:yes stop_codon:yes gene_type:complete
MMEAKIMKSSDATKKEIIEDLASAYMVKRDAFKRGEIPFHVWLEERQAILWESDSHGLTEDLFKRVGK